MDIYISGREAWDYLRRGRYDQAGIAALSGAIGWIPEQEMLLQLL